MKSASKILRGIVFVLAAVFLLVSQMGLIPELNIGFWSILWTMVSAYILIKGIINFQFSGIFFGLAFLAIIYDEFLGIEALTPWPVLGAALLLSIGMHMLFPHRKHKHLVNVAYYTGRDGEDIAVSREGGADIEEHFQEADGECLNFTQVFQSATKYINSRNLSCVNMECVFSSMNIYFNDAETAGGRAMLNIDNVFGTTNLYVPATWTVHDSADNVFASINYKGKSCPDGKNHLEINADNVFGSINIYFI